ncbi:hypothetical protein LC724_27900 [Blautia sp. RD014234]|nr:hypothetical protein [Blautia parvula]
MLQDILWNAGIDPRFDMREAEEEDFVNLYKSVTETLKKMCDEGAEIQSGIYSETKAGT